ncbi:predicted protein [Naegleria gruberi]|uniref:Predicted protein n=1 Tax=Naegleria gruberi TaxID=5762 RepID=D2VHC0_NAEGR|nr:uncharacterized protein NAEGRDRAFT_68163 [Naegleria gruberi]EFC43861.1 predicted protein [Naegleria gruberi]|eukprot:XP_002676605.1 predicted protein [Naegleria gruberi strain NEG-M]
MRESTRYDIQLDNEKAFKIINKSAVECADFRRDLSERIGFEYGTNADTCVLAIDVQQIDNGVVNAVYCLTIKLNDKELKSIVKILPPNWKRLKTLNEVLVIQFLSENVKDFPVPTIYGYDCEGDLIGNEYIFMSKCEGITLNTIYGDMTTDERKHYLNQIVKERSKLSDLKFLTRTCDNDQAGPNPLFGCYQGIEMKNGQVLALIGPNCDTLKGPFRSFNDYIISLIDFRLEDMKIIKNGSLSYFVTKFQRFIEHVRNNNRVSV